MKRNIAVVTLVLNIIFDLYIAVSSVLSIYSMAVALSNVDTGPTRMVLQIGFYRNVFVLIFSLALIILSIISVVSVVRQKDKHNGYN